MTGAVVFDLDGVLVDSEPYWAAGFATVANAELDRTGSDAVRFTVADMHRYEGGRVDESLRRMLRHRGILLATGSDRLQRLTEAVIERVSADFTASPRAIEPSVRTAAWLAAAGVEVAVASSSAADFIDAALLAIGLGDAVRVRRSALPLEHGKPAPDVYLLALADLGRAPGQCLAVEDSTTGLVSALRAGLPTVWLRRAGWDDDPRHTAAEAVRRAGADPQAAGLLVEVTRELTPQVVTRHLAR